MIDDAVNPKIKKQQRLHSGLQISGLVMALTRLDRQIEHALKMLPTVFGNDATHDPFRGMHISPEDVATLLGHQPGVPLFSGGNGISEQDGFNQLSEEFPRLAWLAQAFSLSSFDLDVLLLALAPEVDLRYERLYAYLQDDVTRRHPSVDLALNLLCSAMEEKIMRRNHFSSTGVLVLQGLLHVIPEANQSQLPLLAHYLKLDDQVVRFLLSQNGLDTRLISFCHFVIPQVKFKQLSLDKNIKARLSALANRAWKSKSQLRFYFCGPDNSGKQSAAEALAHELDTTLLVADFASFSDVNKNYGVLLRLVFREARFQEAVLYITGLDTLSIDDWASFYSHLVDNFSESAGITILAGTQPWTSNRQGLKEVISVSFSTPVLGERYTSWQTSLTTRGVKVDQATLNALTNRYRLTTHQIEEAVAMACNQALWETASNPKSQSSISDHSIARPTPSDLFTAARAQTGQDLGKLAHKIQPVHSWDDIVLPEDTKAQLHELCQRVAWHEQVMAEWGFGAKLSTGKGISALFAGSSGTGKTMAAEVIARELELDLYKIDLSGVVSKYIGETEKNLERLFSAATDANAILFFDEADALFGKRSEVHDAHDRYANIEISYLLQKMETYEGLAILSTNLRQNLDEAFVRRLAFTIHFPFPDEENRRLIWKKIWPSDNLLDSKIDLDYLARQFKLSGGNIKNIALLSAFLAAAEIKDSPGKNKNRDGSVKMAHLLHATRREYQKMGKNLTETELYGNLKEKNNEENDE